MHSPITNDSPVRITNVNAEVSFKEAVDKNTVFSTANDLAKYILENLSETGMQTLPSKTSYLEILSNDKSAETAAEILNNLGVTFHEYKGFSKLPVELFGQISAAVPPKVRENFSLTCRSVYYNTKQELRCAKVTDRASRASSLEKFQDVLGISDAGEATIPKLPAELQHEPLSALGEQILKRGVFFNAEHEKEAITLVRNYIATLEPENKTYQLRQIDNNLASKLEKLNASLPLEPQQLAWAAANPLSAQDQGIITQRQADDLATLTAGGMSQNSMIAVFSSIRRPESGVEQALRLLRDEFDRNEHGNAD